MKHITLLAGMALTLPVAAQIADGNFEGGPGGAWTEASTNFGTPYCTMAGCAGGDNPIFRPLNGDFFLWYGGVGPGGTLPEEGSVEQTCTVPAGADVTLSMWVKYPAPGTNGDYLRVLVDGNVVGEILPSDSSLYVEYTGVGFDINAYAGGSHTIRIENMQTTTTAIQSILVDQVEILADGASVGLFDNESAPGIQVFPNPANDNLTLTFNALSGAAAVTITDLSGKIVSAESLGEVSQRTFNFDASNLENGVYMVTIQNGGDVYTQRVVVSH